MTREVSWTLDVADVVLTLTGAPDWVGSFAEDWGSWAGESEGWEVTLREDAGLLTPRGPFFEARPRFADGRCLLEASGFAGEIHPAERRAFLRAHPAARRGDLGYFVRVAFALQAFDRGAILFHAAGIVHRGEAYALFGNSGAGKTTSARLSAGKPVLNDDLLVLRPTGTGWEVWATPFGRRRSPGVRRAPLRALLRLVQAPEDRLTSMSKAAALGDLAANSPVVNADAGLVPELLERWNGILRTTPAYFLHFRRSNDFWEVLDAHVD